MSGASFSVLLFHVSVLVKVLPANAIDSSVMFLDASPLGDAFCPSLTEDLLLDQHLMYSIVVLFHCRMQWTCLL